MSRLRLTIVVLLLRTFSARFLFDWKAHLIPHPDKAHRGGEDAYFASNHLLVVADGVGGWNSYGIDPSKYSKFLCSKASDYFRTDPQFYSRNPKQLMVKAQDDNPHIGSATMVVLSLDESKLKSCYIGDSGFIVIRNYEIPVIIYEFKEQQHGFNFPFQLGRKDQNGDDAAKVTICIDIEVEEGDIVLAGSDGLFDNIDSAELLTMVETANKEGNLLGNLPHTIAAKAIHYGNQSTYKSPFAIRAQKQGLTYNGGKLDDTTVIIAQIGKDTEGRNEKESVKDKQGL